MPLRKFTTEKQASTETKHWFLFRRQKKSSSESKSDESY